MKKSNNKFKKLLPYLSIPLAFAFCAYFLISVVLNPYISTASSIISLITSDKKPDFSSQTDSIFSGASGENEEIINSNSVEIPEYEVHYANLSIENAEISEDLYFGDSDNVLKKGIGQYIGSFIPGYNKPILIGGHNHTHFKNLKNVKIGDEVIITTNYGVYKYKVTETKIINAKDKNEYNLNQDGEKLMLYTCYPFNSYGLTSKRYFVYADKVSGPVIK